MAVLVICGKCQHKFRAKDQAQGLTLKCPNCSAPMIVEGPRVPNHDVFLSYSHKDKSFADAVCNALENRGIRCWIAPRDVVPGEWSASIIDAIEDAGIMVLIVSANSNMSQQVLREVDRAVSKGLIIVPVRIESVDLSKSLEYFLCSCHWLDAFPGPFDEHLKKLATQIGFMMLGSTAAGAAKPPAFQTSVAPSIDSSTNATRHGSWLAKAAAILLVLCAMIAFGHYAWTHAAEPSRSSASSMPTAATNSVPLAKTAISDTPAMRSIDMMKFINPQRDWIRGTWKFTDAGLFTDKDNACPRIRLPYCPCEEYDFLIEFTPTAETHQVYQVCAVNNTSFAWHISDQAAGFAALNGLRFDNRANPTFVARNDLLLVGKVCQSVVKVRRDGVSAWVNGVKLAECINEYGDLRSDGQDGVGAASLGIGTGGSKLYLKKIEIDEVTGHGRICASIPSLPPPTLPAEDILHRSLIDVEPTAAQTMPWQISNIEILRGAGIALNNFLSAGAPSSRLYQIPPGTAAFRTKVAIGPQEKGCLFYIYLDGDLACSMTVGWSGEPREKTIELAIPSNTKTIELRTGCWSGASGSCGVWADPEFIISNPLAVTGKH